MVFLGWGSVQGDHSLPGEGLGEAVRFAGGDEVSVVHEAVGAGAREGLRRLSHEADLLVVANRLGRHSAHGREIPDASCVRVSP